MVKLSLALSEHYAETKSIGRRDSRRIESAIADGISGDLTCFQRQVTDTACRESLVIEGLWDDTGRDSNSNLPEISCELKRRKSAASAMVRHDQ